MSAFDRLSAFRGRLTERLPILAGIRTSHHYLVLALASAALVVSGDTTWVEELYFAAQLDAMILGVALVGYFVLVAENSHNREGSANRSPLQKALSLVVFAYVLFHLLGQGLATDANRLLRGDFSLPSVVMLVTAMAYDLFARTAAMADAAGSGKGLTYAGFIAVDIFVMVATGMIRHRAPEVIDPWIVPRCYGFMAFGRAVLEWYFSRFSEEKAPP